MIDRRESTGRLRDAFERGDGLARPLKTDQHVAKLPMHFGARGVTLDRLFQIVGGPCPVTTREREIPQLEARQRLARVGRDRLLKTQSCGGSVTASFRGVAHIQGSGVALGSGTLSASRRPRQTHQSNREGHSRCLNATARRLRRCAKERQWNRGQGSPANRIR